MICGTGLGVSYTANRFPGVRAALVQDVEAARAGAPSQRRERARAARRPAGRRAGLADREGLARDALRGRPARAARRADRPADAPAGAGTRPSPAGPRRGRSRDPSPDRPRRPAPGALARADRVRELRLGGGARGRGLGAHQQVRRGLSRAAATTAAARSSTRWSSSRSIAPSSFSAPSTRTCSRTPGSQANEAVYRALIEVGDTVLAMNLDHGGHLTHGSPVNFSGKLYRIVPYGVRRDTEQIDYEELRRLALEHRPKLIQCGTTAYSRVLDFDAFRSIADEVGRAALRRHRAHRRTGRGRPAPEPRSARRTWSPPPPTRRCAGRAAA